MGLIYLFKRTMLCPEREMLRVSFIGVLRVAAVARCLGSRGLPTRQIFRPQCVDNRKSPTKIQNYILTKSLTHILSSHHFGLLMSIDTRLHLLFITPNP